MPGPAFVQVNDPSQNTNPSGTTYTAVFNSAVAAGDCAVLGVTWDHSATNATISSVTDTSGNNWTPLDTIDDGGDTQKLATYFCASMVAAAPNACTVTVTWGSGMGFPGMLMAEYGPSAGLDGHTGQVATNNGSTNNVTSGNITTTTDGDTIIGLFVEVAGTNSNITAGTSPITYTLEQQYTSSFMGIEDGAQTTHGSVAATATIASTTTRAVTAVVALKPAGGGGGGIALGWSTFYTGGTLDFLESFEGGTNGTAITASNSAFDTFFPIGGSGSGGNFGVFDSSASVDGVQSAKISSDGAAGDAYYMQHTFSPTTNMVYARFAIKLTANPPVNIFVCTGTTSTNTSASDIRISTGGIVSVRDNFTASAVGTTTVPLGTWFVMEYRIDAVGNTQTVRLYSDLNGTLQETIGGGASTYTQGTLNGLKFGLTGTANTTIWMDAIAISRSNWVGPVLQ